MLAYYLYDCEGCEMNLSVFVGAVREPPLPNMFVSVFNILWSKKMTFLPTAFSLQPSA